MFSSDTAVEKSFVGGTDVLRLHLSIEKYNFCSVCSTGFWLKSVSFLFLHIVNWFKQNINTYGDLLQNERHFWRMFQVYKMKKIFEAFFKFAQWKICFWSRIYKMKKLVFEACFNFTKCKNTLLKRFSTLQNEKHINFWNVFQVYKMKSTFLKRF